MWRIFMGMIESRARALTQRIALPTISILIAASLFSIALCALFIAFFLFLMPMIGPIGSALAVAAAALLLAALALLPFLANRREAPKPAPTAAAGIDLATMLPLISNMVKSRPLVIGALLVALVLALTAKSDDDDRSV